MFGFEEFSVIIVNITTVIIRFYVIAAMRTPTDPVVSGFIMIKNIMREPFVQLRFQIRFIKTKKLLAIKITHTYHPEKRSNTIPLYPPSIGSVCGKSNVISA